MARANILKNALDELIALPAQSPLRRLALPMLVAFRLDLLQRGLLPQDQEQEFVMHILEHSKNVLEEFKEQVLAEGEARGEALTLGRVLSRRLGRPITDVELHALLDWLSGIDRDAATDEVCDLADAGAAENWLSDLARR